MSKTEVTNVVHKTNPRTESGIIITFRKSYSVFKSTSPKPERFYTVILIGL